MAVVARGFRNYLRNISRSVTAGCNLHSGIVVANKPQNDVEDSKYEVSFTDAEWQYVERLLPLKLVPNVNKKAEYPSGWRPQTAKIGDHPYFVERSRNHMLPVYLRIQLIPDVRTTLVKRIHGDIWKLNEDLHKYLEENLNKEVKSIVLEGNCTIKFKGDQVYYCEQFLLSKGF